MNITKISSGLVLILLGVGASATACSSSQDPVPPPTQLVLIAGDRQGVPSVVDESTARKKIVISSLHELLLRRFDRNVTVSIVPVDGDPRAAQSKLYELDIDNPTQRKDSPEKRLEELSKNIADLQASVGESNALGALDTGGRATSSLEDKTLYVFDSGISTAGPLAMQNGLLGPATDVSTIVEQLRATGNVPQMAGVKVHWWGLGQVVSPQSSPPVWAKTKLRELWTAVVEAGGGSVVFHDDAVQATSPSGELPSVTPVEFSDTIAEPISLTIPERAVSFEPETAVFADKDAAAKTLAEVVSALRKSSVSNLWVTGCTANPVGASLEGMQRTSENRARAVADALRSAGLTATLQVRGLGPACPARVPETGSEDEIAAAQASNRQVLITSSEPTPVVVQD